MRWTGRMADQVGSRGMMHDKSQKRVALFRSSLLLLLLVSGEVFLRAFPRFLTLQRQIGFQLAAKNRWSVPHDELGYLTKPNRKDLIQTLDFKYVAESDSHGFPNWDPWPEKADIVILGDSLVTGSGIGR